MRCTIECVFTIEYLSCTYFLRTYRTEKLGMATKVATSLFSKLVKVDMTFQISKIRLNIKLAKFESQSNRSSHPEVFLEKGVLKICTKFTGEYPCRSVISIKLQSNFIEITLRHGCSPVNLVHIFRTPFTNNTSE